MVTRDQHYLDQVGIFMKSDDFGNVVWAKARLVARGFGQREGIDL